jgi:tetratricopeptide (TPR) repeat protein
MTGTHRSHISVRKTWHITLAAVVVLLLFSIFFRQRLRDGYELLSLRFFPSADRAYQYGDEHFSAKDPELYDTQIAAEFFRIAVQLDPKYPYVNHELARLEFLHGNFDMALAYINQQIAIFGTSTPNSYYVRGLIEGYAGDYAAAVRDYGYYLSVDPNNWATANDYAWVLLKAKREKDAAQVTGDALKIHPGNAWLLSTRAIALFEMGDMKEALNTAKEAQAAASNITESQWLVAYPGNDPRVAREGITTLQTSISDNIHKIEAAIAGKKIQS